MASAAGARGQLRPILIAAVAIGACIAAYFVARRLWTSPMPTSPTPGAATVSDTGGNKASGGAGQGGVPIDANPPGLNPAPSTELPQASTTTGTPDGVAAGAGTQPKPDVFTLSMSKEGEAGPIRSSATNRAPNPAANPATAPAQAPNPNPAAVNPEPTSTPSKEIPAASPASPAPTSPPSPTPSIAEPSEPLLGKDFDGTPDELMGLISEGLSAKGRGDLLAARKLLSEVLADERVPPTAHASLRSTLTEINNEVLFSPRVFASDPYARLYEFKAGDRLSKLPATQNLATDWRLITRVNRISNPDRMSLGQKLKLVTGPFHAVVYKSQFRMDLYLGPAEPASERVFVKSVRIGLGDPNQSTTPTGEFIIKKNSKLVDPNWVNPKTGEKFASNDPKNPIGERWLGLEGQGDAAAFTGFGIHGTIDPDSIGQQRSMGCIRLLSDDVELVYELLTEGGQGASRVTIKP